MSMDEVDSLLNELENLGDKVPTAPIPRASVSAAPRTAASRVYSDGIASPERSPVTQRKSGAPPVWKDSNSADINATNCSVCNKRIFLGRDAYLHQGRNHCIDCLCASCGNPIIGTKTTVPESGKNYCQDCTCHRCRKGITDKYGRDGQFKICVSCLCQYCRGPIRDGDTPPYCSACRCVGCSSPLEGQYYPGDDGRRYCGTCIQNQSGQRSAPQTVQQSSQPRAVGGPAPGGAVGGAVGGPAPGGAAPASRGPSFSCNKCSTVINGEFVDCNGGRFHKTCFSCVECGHPGTQILGAAKNVYCNNCHPDKAICCVCRGALRGGGLEALGRLYHDQCFTCSRCNNVLPGGKFKELDGFILCTHCAIDVVNRGLKPL